MHIQGCSIGEETPKQPKAETPSPLSRSRKGYITLSPHRSKIRSKLESYETEKQPEKKSRVSEYRYTSECERYVPKQNEENMNLMIKVEKPFKPIPKFPQNELIIKSPNSKTPTEMSKSRKTKISITRISHLSEIEGRRQVDSTGDVNDNRKR